MAEDYLESYGDVSVHRLMLNDHPRTIAYKDAILGNSSVFKDKVVMDVGCGTGILSIFCAQAGAKKVYAVESSSIAKLAKKVVCDNKLEDTISVIESCVETVKIDEKVDIIVSEWMGFYLVHEGMLESVLFARDTFLTPEGLMFPQTATLYVAACELPEYFNFWEDVYGVNMTSVGLIDRQQMQEPVVKIVKPSDVLTEEDAIAWFDLKEVSVDEIKKISIKIVKPVKKDGFFQGITFWFDVDFSGGYSLKTGPEYPPTHWQQTAVVLPNSYPVNKGDVVAFEVKMESGENARKYNLEVTILNPDEEEHCIPCDCDNMKCVIIKAHLQRTCGIEDEYVEPEEEEEEIETEGG